VVLLAMLLAISSPAKAGGISRRLINNRMRDTTAEKTLFFGSNFILKVPKFLV